MANIQKSYIEQLAKILDDNHVCSSHGITHAINVLNHAQNALQFIVLDENKQLLVLLASLFHDADDHKFFPDNEDFDNLQKIMLDHYHSKEDIELVKRMVDLVSSSKNGDNIPYDIIGKEWMLIPRYSDRLEALGEIGIVRCYQYNITSNAQLFVKTTPRPVKEEDIWKYATIERYNLYNGISDSMVDHYYDKLLRASIFPIRNPYFDKETSIRIKPLIDFLIYFGNTPEFNDGHMNEYIKKLNI